MKKVILVLLTLVSFIYAEVGRVAASSGKVVVFRDSAELFAKTGMVIEEGDIIKTIGMAKVQLLFKDETVITIGKNSQFGVDEYLFDEKNNKQNAKFSITKGAFKAITGQIGKIAPKKFKLKTNTATIGIRGTHFLGQISDSGDRIACTLGEIAVTSLATGITVEVPAGMITTVAPDVAPSTPREYKTEEINEISDAAGMDEKQSEDKEDDSRTKKREYKKQLKEAVSTETAVDEESTERAGLIENKPRVKIKVEMIRNIIADIIQTVTADVDTTPPSPPKIDYIGATNDNRHSVSGTAEAGSTVTLYRGIQKLGSTTADDKGVWSFIPPALDDGEYKIRAVATDSAGNKGGSSQVQTVIIDTVAPSDPVVDVIASTKNTTPTISGTADARSRVTVTVNGESYTATASADGAWSITTNALSLDDYEISVKATDIAGNNSSAVSKILSIIKTYSGRQFMSAAVGLNSPEQSSDSIKEVDQGRGYFSVNNGELAVNNDNSFSESVEYTLTHVLANDTVSTFTNAFTIPSSSTLTSPHYKTFVTDDVEYTLPFYSGDIKLSGLEYLFYEELSEFFVLVESAYRDYSTNPEVLAINYFNMRYYGKDSVFADYPESGVNIYDMILAAHAGTVTKTNDTFMSNRIDTASAEMIVNNANKNVFVATKANNINSDSAELIIGRIVDDEGKTGIDVRSYEAQMDHDGTFSGLTSDHENGTLSGNIFGTDFQGIGITGQTAASTQTNTMMVAGFKKDNSSIIDSDTLPGSDTITLQGFSSGVMIKDSVPVGYVSDVKDLIIDTDLDKISGTFGAATPFERSIESETGSYSYKITFEGLNSDLESAYINRDTYGVVASDVTNISKINPLNPIIYTEKEGFLVTLPENSDDYASWGYWSASFKENEKDVAFYPFSTFVAGETTPEGSVPTTSSFTYSGKVLGTVASDSNMFDKIQMNSNNVFTLNLDFGGNVNDFATGQMKFETQSGERWNVVISNVTGTINSSRFIINDGFSTGAGSDVTVADGAIAGRYFGPDADTIGGNFIVGATLNAENKLATGVFKASK